MRVCQIKKGQQILIEKLRFTPDLAIGKRFGLFEVSAGKLVEATYTPPQEEVIENANVVKESSEENGTLAGPSTEPALTDSNIRQRLTHDEIKELKASAPASELISKLVDGNVAFAERTTFSQKKYIQKKTKKFSDRVLIFKPNIRLVCESYYKRDSERLGNLRLDQLGLILQLSGIHVGSRVLLYEQSLGIVAASILERLAGEGACIFLHRGRMPQSIPCFHAMMFGDKILSTFYPVRIASLLAGSVVEDDKEDEPKPGKLVRFDTSLASSESKDSDSVPIGSGNLEMDEDNGRPTSPSAVEAKKRERLGKEKLAFELLRQPNPSEFGSLDSLIFVVRTLNPVDILEKAFASLKLSGTIVIFSAIQQHILTAYEWLKDHGVVNLQMSDQFCRHYQVLPSRTHPLMQETIANGYVLSGIKVLNKKPFVSVPASSKMEE
uniref:tRNA (adenine(58)-N(1))-methyltransferase non-catalytic subunit TRM6 n=1 Tax=Acrobeloides nanus TaxID=290746 RepID=A0A914CKF6_9BILA